MPKVIVPDDSSHLAIFAELESDASHGGSTPRGAMVRWDSPRGGAPVAATCSMIGQAGGGRVKAWKSVTTTKRMSSPSGPVVVGMALCQDSSSWFAGGVGKKEEGLLSQRRSAKIFPEEVVGLPIFDELLLTFDEQKRVSEVATRNKQKDALSISFERQQKEWNGHERNKPRDALFLTYERQRRERDEAEKRKPKDALNLAFERQQKIAKMTTPNGTLALEYERQQHEWGYSY